MGYDPTVSSYFVLAAEGFFTEAAKCFIVVAIGAWVLFINCWAQKISEAVLGIMRHLEEKEKAERYQKSKDANRRQRGGKQVGYETSHNAENQIN